jgi:O-antigen ligase
MAGFVNHYSTNGIYLAIGSGIAFCVLFGDKKNRLKLCFAIMTTFALLLTSKRGQTIFFVISLVITYFIYNSNRPQKRFIKLLLLISLALILIFVSSMFVPEVLNAFLRLTNSADPTGGRSPLFQEAINLFLANPLFGVGWGGYKFIAKNTVGLYYPTMYAETQAHNIYLQLLSEVGIVGFSLFVFIMFWMCRNSVKLLRKCRQGIYKIGNSLERALAICLFIQVFFILYGLTGNPLYDNIMIYPYMMACAGVLSIQYKIRLIYRKRAGNLENRHFNIS